MIGEIAAPIHTGLTGERDPLLLIDDLELRRNGIPERW